MESHHEEILRRYRVLVEQLPLVVYVDALDAESSNIFTSKQVEPILGYTVEEWASDPSLFVRALHPEDRERVLEAHSRTHTTHEPLSIEYRLHARDGRVVWIRDEGVVVLDDDGMPLNLQGYLLDITDEREAQAELRQLALYDPLTGLANRAFFHEQFRHTAAVRREPPEQAALLFVDLNEFKGVNDRWGHDCGDSVLATLGRRIEETIRAGDYAARLGGDEFAVVLPVRRDPAEAVQAAQRLLDRIAEPITLDGRHLTITASVGIALGSESERMLIEADAAMYRAKTQGALDYAFFDPALDSAAVEHSRRVAELAHRGRRGPVHPRLPARRRPRRARHHGLRGAPALAAPDARPGRAARLHPARRGDRADRAARPVGASRGVRVRQGPLRGPSTTADGGQRLRAAAPAPGLRRPRAAGARRVGLPTRTA